MELQKARSTFDQYVRNGIFQPVSRHIAHDSEDRIQDAICQTWETFRRYSERGQTLEPAVLVHACKQRARDLSRNFAGDGTFKKLDVYDRRNQLDGRVDLLGFDHRDSTDDTNAIGLAVSADTNPTRRVHSAIDLNRWLTALPAPDCKLLELRAAGHTWKELGQQLDMPVKAAWERCTKLGLALSEHAGLPVRKTTQKRGRRAVRFDEAA